MTNNINETQKFAQKTPDGVNVDKTLYFGNVRFASDEELRTATTGNENTAVVSPSQVLNLNLINNFRRVFPMNTIENTIQSNLQQSPKMGDILPIKSEKSNQVEKWMIFDSSADRWTNLKDNKQMPLGSGLIYRLMLDEMTGNLVVNYGVDVSETNLKLNEAGELQYTPNKKVKPISLGSVFPAYPTEQGSYHLKLIINSQDEKSLIWEKEV